MQPVLLSCGTTITHQDLENAGISYVPCGQVDGKDQPLLPFAHLWSNRKQITRETYGKKANAWNLAKMTGFQIFTGEPTYRVSPSSPDGFIYLVDVDIESHLLATHPDVVERITGLYRQACDGTPCIVQTKSQGLRLSAFAPYLDGKRAYRDDNGKMLLEIFSRQGLSRLDHRYAFIEGTILDLPVVPHKTIADIHGIISEVATEQKHDPSERKIVEKSQIGNLDIEWDQDNRSQLFSTQHCQKTKHTSNRLEVRFTRYRDGSIDGKCFNCGETWYEIPPPEPTRKRSKFSHNPDFTPEPTNTLDENRAKREQAADAFFERSESRTLEMHFVRDSTGTGKSHTYIAKAKTNDKRSLALLPHSELASQAVEIAFSHGFRAFHFKGRGHNWSESGIEAIPVEMRTADLFSRNNCIMYDQIEAYTNRRMAARTYCELQCDFRSECVHLEQYRAVERSNFVASATPNLLFDLNMRPYLKSIVRATSEPTDVDVALDAMFEIESQPESKFDFAIVDDYGITGLFTEIEFSRSEFKALRKAWKGTPVADFARLIEKAFEKKKPHKIIQALRKALEKTETHHPEITEALTKHARRGVVRTAVRAKHSKESKRLLSEKQIEFTDNGRLFIPVDYDAYLELTKQGKFSTDDYDAIRVPTIHPKHIDPDIDIGESVLIPTAYTQAILSGIPLDEITPIWSNHATPIKLIEIFLNSIGNPRNAPVKRQFRATTNNTENEPDAILAFSIPPQAPVGIIDAIAMLSATTEPEAVKTAFEGQPVDFSTHIGNPVDFAKNVQVYQYQDARLTSASVFEYPTDDNGKRLLNHEPIGLTETAINRLDKLNDWAKQSTGLTAFISYKEFTTEPFIEHVDGFDVITHFDKTQGMNFDGLKYLVIFGYPKVRHDVLMNDARTQHASDTEPLPTGDYHELTHEITTTEHGYEITERQYQDPRLEIVRRQLASDKLDQSVGRARLPVWTDTTTILFTDAPVPRITDRATLFSKYAFERANTPGELSTAMDRITQAEQTANVKAVMESKGVSQRTAYEHTQANRNEAKADRDALVMALHAKGKTPTEIAQETGVPRATIHRIIAKHK